ncbi:hypothetical protein ACFLTG_01565 [Chloroflexota bacterium]
MTPYHRRGKEIDSKLPPASCGVASGGFYEPTSIIEEYMLEYIDGIECWHARHGIKTILIMSSCAREHSLIITGGTNCHQNPMIMGTLEIPNYVAEQFRR